MSKKLILASILLLAIFIPAGAQSSGSEVSLNEDEKEKAAKELEVKSLALFNEVIKDVGALRSAENRVRLLAIAADMLWKKDAARARSFLIEAARELGGISAALQPDDTRFQIESQGLFELRHQILQTASRLDPRLALDFINATKNPSQHDSPSSGQPDMETSLRLRVASEMVEKDPKMSLQIAEESLKSGISYDIINLIPQLYHKDKQSCEKLVRAVIEKLHGLDLLADQTAGSIASSLLNAAITGKREAERQQQNQGADNADPVRFSERDTADLMEMVVKAAMSISSGTDLSQRLHTGYGQPLFSVLQGMMAEVERYMPIEARALAGKIEEYKRIIGARDGLWQKYNNLGSTGSVDDFLKAIDDAPQEMRAGLYHQAAQRAMNEGNTDRARQIVSEKISDPAYSRDMLLNIDRQLLWRTINEGKVEEARRMIQAFPKKEERVSFLIQLATIASSRGDKKTAIDLVNEAQSLTGNPAESYPQMQAQLQIAQVCAKLDPGRSFDLIEQNIDRFNQLMAAASMLEGFDIQNYFKDSELVLGPGNQLSNMLIQYLEQLGAIARTDFNRAKTAAERFQRFEVQVLARLQVALKAISEQDDSAASSRNVIIPIFNSRFRRQH
jgi:hypothetical protein